jgi:predicted cupin superfamily sugar epimerase
MQQVRHLIQKFDLQPHPEGGWFCQTYRSSESITASSLPPRFEGDRVFATAIYFLLEKGNFSAFHRIKSDECWHFYSGDPLEIFIIDPNGSLEIIALGNDFEKGQKFQHVVPATYWFASRPAKDSGYSFVGCTVSPGFEFDDFELANANELSSRYPQHKDLVSSLCR